MDRYGFPGEGQVCTKTLRCTPYRREKKERKPRTDLYVVLRVLSNERHNLLGRFLLGREVQRWVAVGVV